MKLMVIGHENVGKTTTIRCLGQKWNKVDDLGALIIEPIDTKSKPPQNQNRSTDGIDIGSFQFLAEANKSRMEKNPAFNNSFYVSSTDSDKSTLKKLFQKTVKASQSPTSMSTGTLPVTVNVWDFAGQDVYYTTHEFFLTQRSIYLIIFSLTLPGSEQRVEFWLQSLKARVPKASVIIVGTHAEDPAAGTYEQINKRMEEMRVRYKKSFGNFSHLMTMPISCVGETIGIDELRVKVQELMMKQRQMGEKYPSSYLMLEKLLIEKRKRLKIPIISFPHLKVLGALCGIKDPKALLRAAKFLHEIGSILYFDTDPSLANLVILDPRWLTKIMATMFTTKHSWIKNGILRHSVLGQIWKEYPFEIYSALFFLLQKFEITFELKGEVLENILHLYSSPQAQPIFSIASREPSKTTPVNSPPRPNALPPKITPGKSELTLNVPPKKSDSISPSGSLASIPVTPGGISSGSGLGLGSATSTGLGPALEGGIDRAVSLSVVDESPKVDLEDEANVDEMMNIGAGSEADPIDAIPFDVNGVSLVPALLPSTRPAEVLKEYEHDTNQIVIDRTYKFPFIPKGLFSRFIVRALVNLKPLALWTDGFLAKSFTGEIVLVEVSNDGKVGSTVDEDIVNDILIQVTRCKKEESSGDAESDTESKEVLPFSEATESKGEEAVELPDSMIETFIEMLDTIEDLLREWPNLSYTRHIRSPSSVRGKVVPPSYIPVDMVEDAIIKGGTTLLFQEELLQLSSLAPDIALTIYRGKRVSYSDLNEDKEIGVGGFARVYLGSYEGNEVAIKKLTLNAEAGQSEQSHAFREFRQEIMVQSKLDHVNVVKLLCICMNPFSMAIEYVRCGNLFKFIHKYEINMCWKLKLKIASDIAKGIRYLHTRKPPIVHIDMKTPNIMMDSLDANAPVCAKITDFGTSKFYTGVPIKGRFVDNPIWLAPEALLQKGYDCRVDTYAFGMICWEILTRQLVWPEISFMVSVEEKIIKGERPTLCECPEEFEFIIKKCWDPDPELRPDFDLVLDKIKVLEETDLSYYDELELQKEKVLQEEERKRLELEAQKIKEEEERIARQREEELKKKEEEQRKKDEVVKKQEEKDWSALLFSVEEDEPILTSPGVVNSSPTLPKKILTKGYSEASINVSSSTDDFGMLTPTSSKKTTLKFKTRSTSSRKSLDEEADERDKIRVRSNNLLDDSDLSPETESKHSRTESDSPSMSGKSYSAKRPSRKKTAPSSKRVGTLNKKFDSNNSTPSKQQSIPQSSSQGKLDDFIDVPSTGSKRSRRSNSNSRPSGLVRSNTHSSGSSPSTSKTDLFLPKAVSSLGENNNTSNANSKNDEASEEQEYSDELPLIPDQDNLES